MQLLQRRHAGAQRIRQAPHRVSQHDQHPGAGQQGLGAGQGHAFEQPQEKAAKCPSVGLPSASTKAA
jgi:hypothetical protein